MELGCNYGAKQEHK